MLSCAYCALHACYTNEQDKIPKECISKDTKLIDKSLELYKGLDKKIAYNSALVESEGYRTKTRIEEIIDFANKCNFKKIGIAFCLSLSNETKIVNKIFVHNKFEVYSAMCKMGGTPKETLGITDEQKVHPGGHEAMCNPIGQALYCNSKKTDFNVLIGLCVGHDSLFIKHSDAPVTVLIVKDRVLANNPTAAIYTANSYYKEKLFPKYD